MSDIPPSADVVICGAGMTGICTAYFLTKMGIRDILPVDRRSPLTLTSDKSAETYCNGWLDETMFRFAQRSIVNVCHGASMDCAAGELCAAWLTGNRLPEYAGELSLQRYYDTR
jgi:glycine/D-amino acid oxidase-like deaminating enzyme